ncbi:MAG: DoxX family protein [Gemmatimonadota bacterium]
MELLSWIGRILFAMIFIVAGARHVLGKGIEYAEMKGLPAPGISVRIGGLLAVAGGLSVLLWYRVDIGAILLLLFLFTAAFKFHDFWRLDDPMEKQNQQSHFMKNMAMAGAALVFWVLYGGGVMAGL